MNKVVSYNKVHNRFKLNGTYLNKEDCNRIGCVFIKEGNESFISIGNFLLNWFDVSSYIEVQTSGTTGKPKLIRIDKQEMVESALATGDFFNLQPGNKALLCLSTDYIAGKMMLVRAIILGLELDVVLTSSFPLQSIAKEYDFVAMVPLQVENSLLQLNQVKKLIIGGAAVNSSLKNKLKSFNTEIYETYGMTETITHIAAKSINEKCFQALPNVTLSIDDRNCLVIKAPKISNEIIITNDIVDLISKTEFKWLGRFDNVINSGGIKLFPEQIEEKLRDKIKERFFIAALDDSILGQKVVLIIESQNVFTIDKKVFEELSKYEKPKEVFYVDNFVATKTSKINRKETIKKIKVV
jgi:O-succinylbenzoic acid--CoA ligase